MKNVLKRFASMFAIVCVLMTCMVPSVFAVSTEAVESGKSVNEVTSKVAYKVGDKVTYDINEVITHIKNENTGISDDMARSMVGNYLYVETTGVTDQKDGGVGAWQRVLAQYRGVISGLAGVAAITMIVFFIINFMKLGAAAGNPQARSQALMGIIWTGLAAAGCGGVAIFVGFFYNVLL